MSDRLVVQSPLGSPDTLRATLQLSKRFYDLHTPRQFGYSDVDDLQYVGTSENFGSELFFEAKKLKLTKIPSKYVHVSTPLASLFRIEPADYIDAYPQIGLRMCTPITTALNPARQYKIEFSDVTEVIIPRALHDGYSVINSSDTSEMSIYRTTFYMTTTPPKLKYYNLDGTFLFDEELRVGDNSTVYYLPKNAITAKMTTLDEGVVLTDDILKYPELAWLYFTNDELVTLPKVKINDNVDQNGNPLLVIGTNPQASMYIHAGVYGVDNVPETDTETEGHWFIRIYGDFNESNDLPRIVTFDIGLNDEIILKPTVDIRRSPIAEYATLNKIWIVTSYGLTTVTIQPKNYSEKYAVEISKDDLKTYFQKYFDGNVYGDLFVPKEYEHNTGVQIRSVDFVLLNQTVSPINPIDWSTIQPEDVLAVHHIGFEVDDRITHICLLDAISSMVGTVPSFRFGKIIEGDYKYDPNLLNQGYFTWVSMDQLGMTETGDGTPTYPFLRIKFADEYFYKHESDLNHFVSGVHLDYTTDWSDNSVPKQYGVIHRLGEFDGLPEYFKYYLVKENQVIHHAHVEMYTIRDDPNVRNQKPMDKQTAAIILDSAIPQNEIKKITEGNVVITYAAERNNESTIQPKYVTNEDAIVSTNNYPSDIRYHDNGLFLDDTICKYEEREECPRFIYHGNGYFSLGYIDFDPDLETGRGYLITNDPAAYINNEISKNPKAERTAARICDIPTSFTQMLSVSGKSPTLLMDEKYIRMEAPVMLNRAIVAEDTQGAEHVFIENDIDRLWNINPTLRFTGLEGYTPYVQNLIVNRSPGVNRLQQTPFSRLSDVRGNNGGFMWKQPAFQTFKVPSSEIRRVINEQAPIPEGASCKYYLGNGGSGYAVGDKIGFNIGGVYLKIDVIDVNDGAITDYQFHMDTRYPGMNYDDDGSLTDIIPDIPLSNFDGQTTTFTTSTISGTGSGATFVFTLSDKIMSHYKPPQYDWQYGRMPYNPESQPPYGDVLREGHYAITCDSWSNSVHINELKYPLDENDAWDVAHRIQLTGYMGTTNPVYDDVSTLHLRKPYQSMIYHLLSDRKFVNSDMLNVVNNPSKYVTFKATLIPYDPTKFFTYESVREGMDFSKLISDQGLNQFGTFFSIVEKMDGLTVDSANAYLLSYKFELDMLDTNQLPSYNQLNVSSFNIYTASLIFSQMYNYPFMFNIHSRANDQYTDHYGFMTKRYNTELKFVSMIQAYGKDYPETAVALYTNSRMNYPVYRITQIPRDIDPLKPYHITDVYKISDIDPADVTLIQYYPNQAYTDGQFIYNNEESDVYKASRSFTSTSFEADIESGNLVYYSDRESVNGHNYNYLDTTTEYGGFLPLKDIYDEIVTVNTYTYQNNPLYVFRIDDPTFNYETLNGFRMYDGDTDISEITLLIINERQYVFRDNKWEWNYHT